MRRRPELMQLEMGISTSRYLPASGTAGLARSLVSGNRRVPCPPPMITESTLLVLAVWRLVCSITRPLFVLDFQPLIAAPRGTGQAVIVAEPLFIGAGPAGSLHLTGYPSRRKRVLPRSNPAHLRPEPPHSAWP